jgi:hypothetical protein
MRVEAFAGRQRFCHLKAQTPRSFGQFIAAKLFGSSLFGVGKFESCRLVIVITILQVHLGLNKPNFRQ